MIVDRSSDQRAFAGVADAGATRPPHGNVAGFGKFEQALESGIPRDRQPASRKRNRRAEPRRSRGKDAQEAGKTARYRV